MRRMAPITAPAATTSRRSCPTGGISSWTSAPCRWNQGLIRISSRQRWSASCVSHRKMSTPQLPWRGLTTSGGSMSGRLTVGPEMLGARMRDPRPGEQAGGEQLVVCGGEGRGRVEDAETAPLEPEKLEEAGLDTVDGREDVEPAERDVTRLEPLADLARDRRAPRRCRARARRQRSRRSCRSHPVPRTATRVAAGAVSLACALR